MDRPPVAVAGFAAALLFHGLPCARMYCEVNQISLASRSTHIVAVFPVTSPAVAKKDRTTLLKKMPSPGPDRGSKPTPCASPPSPPCEPFSASVESASPTSQFVERPALAM